jgi:mRNA interferase YafQ
MLNLFRTNTFKKQYKKLNDSEKESIKAIVVMLVNEEILDVKYKDHKLVGNFKGLRECHVKPDLLLIYKIDNNILELTLVNVGSHSSLFR